MMWPLAELLPHAGDMILLDSIESWDEESIVALARVTDDCLFARADGSWPVWLGIELMAQAVAAYAGLRAKSSGGQVQLGFLLGTRKFDCNVMYFPVNTLLRISARCSLEEDCGMGVFECSMLADNIEVQARLNVYRPHQVDSYIQEVAP